PTYMSLPISDRAACISQEKGRSFELRPKSCPADHGGLGGMVGWPDARGMREQRNGSPNEEIKPAIVRAIRWTPMCGRSLLNRRRSYNGVLIGLPWPTLKNWAQPITAPFLFRPVCGRLRAGLNGVMAKPAHTFKIGQQVYYHGGSLTGGTPTGPYTII